MKAYLSLMGLLCPKIKQKTNIPIGIYKPPIITFLILLCFVFAAEAQEIEVHSTPVAKADTKIVKSEIVPLKLGDKLPDELWDLPLQVMNHPERKETITLNDYKGDLIILDFWATWCSSCIAAFPIINSLQKEFESDVSILLVSYENTSKLENFFQNSIAVTKISDFAIPSIKEDSILKKHFVHKLLPHYVWIGSDGKLLATTSSLGITKENLLRFKSGKPLDVLIKKDVDKDRPLFLSEDLPAEQLELYSILIKGHLEGTGSGTRTREKEGISIGKLYTNTPLFNLFMNCFRAMDEDFNPQRLTVDVIEPGNLLVEQSGMPESEWYKQNSYSMDFIVPVEKKDSLYHYMLRSLNAYSQYKGTIRRVERTCWALTIDGDASNRKFEYKNGEIKRENLGQKIRLNKLPMHFLVEYLNENFDLEYLVVDKTAFKGNIDIAFKTEIKNLNDLQKDLQAHGLILKKERIWVKEYSITDQND